LKGRRAKAVMSASADEWFMKDIANFLFEVGMLQKTPRSGYQFLGSGCESVA